MSPTLFFTIFQAIIPILVTLGLGYIAAWRRHFSALDARILIRLVMLYALPLALFSSILSTPREKIISSGPLSLLIILGMVGGYCLIFSILRWILKQPQDKAALITMTMTGPSVPFIGIPVLGQLFGIASAVPISIAALAMNLFQLPLTIILINNAQKKEEGSLSLNKISFLKKVNKILHHFLHSCQEPVVFAPLLGILCVLLGIKFPPFIKGSFTLLGHATGGVALFASGIILYSRQARFSSTVGYIILIRNIIIPLVIYSIASLWHFSLTALQESVITMAMPSAAITVMLAMRYHILEREIASVLFFGTLSALLTMASFIWLTHL